MNERVDPPGVHVRDLRVIGPIRFVGPIQVVANVSTPAMPQDTEAAEARARKLLRSYLTPYQQWTLDNFELFYERSALTSEIYALSSDYFMIRTLDKKPLTWHGLHLFYRLPRSDCLLAQLLALRTGNPDELGKACSFPHEVAIHTPACRRLVRPEALKLIIDGRYCRV